MKTETKSSSCSSSSASSTRRESSQLELTFDRSTACQGNPRRRRQTVASLWFRRMRQIVDNATGFRPALPPRPLQPLLGNALSHEKQLAE